MNTTETVTVRLLKPHTHAGADYPAGEILEVPRHVAIWLGEQQIAEAAPAPRTRQPKKTQKEG